MSLDVMGMVQKMPYGKYKGRSIGAILLIDHQYIRWAVDEVVIRISEEAETKLKEYEAIRKRTRRD